MNARPRSLAVPALALLLAPGLGAQEPPAAPAATPPAFNAFNKEAYGYVKKMILASAEKMPEENYGFKPAETVRSFGQVLGHVADSSNYFCSAALGEKNPAKNFEKTKTSKADLIAALKDGFAYCDRAYDGLTPSTAAESVRIFNGRPMQKIDVLTTNTMHGVEHYGNLIVYLRIKGLVPPSSEQGPAPAAKK